MRQNKSSFQRTGEVSRESGKCSDWLESFAEQMAVQEQISKKQEQSHDPNVKTAKTAVEVARERQDDHPSIYEMMSSIISRKTPKYSSVEEAVKDYQERTGLAQYLKAQKEEGLESVASQIVNADDELGPEELAELRQEKAENTRSHFSPEELEDLEGDLEHRENNHFEDEEPDMEEPDDELAEIIQMFSNPDGPEEAVSDAADAQESEKGDTLPTSPVETYAQLQEWSLKKKV